MKTMDYRKYEIWHDECKINGYYHGILFVPTDKKEELIFLLKKTRDEHKLTYDHDIKFAGSLKKETIGRVISNHLSIFSHIIKTKDNGNTKIYNFNGKAKHEKDYKHFLEICGLFGCRFGFLKIADNMEAMYFDTYAKKVETTFRFLLKACCHSMFDKDNPIEISKFYFDGDEHHTGKINMSTILKGEFRDYCKLSNPIIVDSRQIKKRNDDTKLMICFIDNIVGSWRALLEEDNDKNQILYSIKGIHKRVKEGKIYSNINSAWYKSISLSEFYIENNEIKFHDMFRNPEQKSLFNNEN